MRRLRRLVPRCQPMLRTPARVVLDVYKRQVKYTFTVTAATKVQATFKLSNSIEQLAQRDVAVFVTNGGTRLEIAGAAEGTEVRLYDYTGQLLLASTEQALDISALPAGSYIVLVGDYTTRIVK